MIFLQNFGKIEILMGSYQSKELGLEVCMSVYSEWVYVVGI
jgi:hypothetical protein